MIKTIQEGRPSVHRVCPSRVLTVGNESIEVVYVRLHDGSVTISNAWVQT